MTHTDLGMYIALASAWLNPEENPARTCGAWLAEVKAYFTPAVQGEQRRASWWQGVRCRLRNGLAWFARRERSRSFFRKTEGFESPAFGAGRANLPLSGKVNPALSRPVSYFQNATRLRLLRLKRNRKPAFAGARPAEPEGDSRLLKMRMPRSYPLVAETPAVYYVMSGAKAGQRAL